MLIAAVRDSCIAMGKPCSEKKVNKQPFIRAQMMRDDIHRKRAKHDEENALRRAVRGGREGKR